MRWLGGIADIAIASRKRWVPRRKEILGAFVVTAASHLIGLAPFVIISQAWFDIRLLSFIIPPVCWIILMLAPRKSLSSSNSVPTAPLYIPLKAINMCLASTLISVLSVLNFSLAALLVVARRTTILGLPI